MARRKSKSRELRVHIKQVCMGKKDTKELGIVVLGTSSRVVPIFIGWLEACAIEAGQKGRKHERPLTHELFLNALDETGYRVEKLVVAGMENTTFIGELYVAKGQKQGIALDCRPSDGIVTCPH